MAQKESLREKQAELLNSFHDHETAVRSLQRRALSDILPDVAEQLGLEREDVEWAKEYLEDTGSAFRMFKRHKFVLSFAHEALRQTVLWRLQTLKPALGTRTSLAIHCLPPNIRDTSGRPIVVLRLADANIAMDNIKTDITVSLERMRVFLRDANPEAHPPVLQFTMVVDVSRAPVKATPVDLVHWYLREVQPRFHGMLAAALVVNYSWAHSGVWAVTKHVMPASAVSRVVFVSPRELLQYLPPNYEGHIKRLEELTTPSLTSSLHRLPPSPPATPPAFARRASAPSAPSDPRHRPPISRFSLTNPFFGYPIDAPRAASPSPNNVPALRHGRRRKRDLVRALAVLFWQRWKSRIGAGVLLLSIFGLIKIVMVVRRLHGRRGGLWRIA